MRLEGATWRPDGVPVLVDLDLEVAPGRITAILGRSGCGKSSLLRVLAGVRALESGRVSARPARPAFVFQDPTLLPWRSVRANVDLPLELSGAEPDTRRQAVDAALASVGLAAFADRLPAELSGGQRMRASLARALVARPGLLLLDEPFAALDLVTRADMLRLVLHAHAELGCTTVLVTHDVGDAARLADRVLVVDGPPLRVVADHPIAAPRPRDSATVGGLLAALVES